MTYINETNNLPLVTNNDILFGVQDYSTLKGWQSSLDNKLGLIDDKDGAEFAYFTGAKNMLSDVVNFMEWPTNETIDNAQKIRAGWAPAAKVGKAAMKHGVKAPVPEFHLSTNKVLVGVAVGIVVVAVWKDRKKAKQEAARRQAVRIVRPDREQQD